MKSASVFRLTNIELEPHFKFTSCTPCVDGSIWNWSPISCFHISTRAIFFFLIFMWMEKKEEKQTMKKKTNETRYEQKNKILHSTQLNLHWRFSFRNFVFDSSNKQETSVELMKIIALHYDHFKICNTHSNSQKRIAQKWKFTRLF